ncbi:MAG: VWA domain-containing protein [Ignavibacteriota bacterium]
MNRLAVLLLAPLVFAQNTPPPAIRIDVNLVQVDAVVTDSHNRRVADLQASDFELLQDGKPQAITNFSYVAGKATPVSARVAAPKLAKGEVPPPAPVVQPADVHRALAFVVDDEGWPARTFPPCATPSGNSSTMTCAPTTWWRSSVPAPAMGALQQFTTDKRLLHEALDRVQYGRSRVGREQFRSLGVDAERSRRARSNGVGASARRYARRRESGRDPFRGELDGRPSGAQVGVVLFTENIRMMYRGTTDVMVSQAVRQLSDAASRASVVIHAIDPRGLPNFNLTAQDDTSQVSRRRASRVPAQRAIEVERTEEGMFALSEATGGLFQNNVNDLAAALRRAADD